MLTMLALYATPSPDCGSQTRITVRFDTPDGGTAESISIERGASPDTVAARLRLLADWVEELPAKKGEPPPDE